MPFEQAEKKPGVTWFEKLILLGSCFTSKQSVQILLYLSHLKSFAISYI